MRQGLVSACLLCLVACRCASPTLPPPEVPEAPPAASQTQQSHLLLFPEADAESLLGRAVQATKAGGWTISDTRAPGCEVSVRRERSQFQTARQVDASSITSLAAGYAALVSLEAKFGDVSSADIDITNSEILHADLRGPCGDLVVDTVFVGRGRRRLSATRDRNLSASANVGPVHLAPGTASSSRVVDEIAWEHDQAYGFTFSKSTTTEVLDVRVAMPSIVAEGQDVAVHFESKQPAWLVVYYIDSTGRADVLWPSNEEPEPRVAPDAPLVLPSPRETSRGFRIKATLATANEPSRETLVVYGFADKRDFDALKPAAGTGNSDGAAFAAELTRKLQHVPMSRWSRVLLGYVIEPGAHAAP